MLASQASEAFALFVLVPLSWIIAWKITRPKYK